MDTTSTRRGETYRRLMLASFGVKSVGADNARNKGRGAASDGAHSRVEAGIPDEGGTEHPPIGRQGGGWQPMGMRKSPGSAGAGSVYGGLGEKPEEPTPENRRVLLRIVASNKHIPARRKSAGICLVLVQ